MYPLRKLVLTLQWQWLSVGLTVDDGGVVVGLRFDFHLQIPVFCRQ